MSRAPYCTVTYKVCRNPECRRAYVVVARRGCSECRRCRRDGYCSLKCKFDVLEKAAATAAAR